ncbi:tripartite tricarboxylate transporter substrate-binding protein, partial [Achromobacter xylosoxidans]|uniref:tripartite tricarboxylate transporter substrate-binding protein n=1 Tax=Alcaligenes xylosoxydans xylosoxydans TaxID=85698 RepID=UPI003760F698
MIARIRTAALACLSALALQATLAAAAAHAAYPDQAIKLVVPFTPGGATDAVARVLANRLSGKLGQAVIVENRPGAWTVIGATAGAQAEPHGYSVMLSGRTTNTLLAAIKRDLPYDPRGSFEHNSNLAL